MAFALAITCLDAAVLSSELVAEFLGIRSFAAKRNLIGQADLAVGEA